MKEACFFKMEHAKIVDLTLGHKIREKVVDLMYVLPLKQFQKMELVRNVLHTRNHKDMIRDCVGKTNVMKDK